MSTHRNRFYAAGFWLFTLLAVSLLLTGPTIAQQPVTISGSLTNISGTITLPTGASTAANQASELTLLGAVAETAPASDTASSGLNGRLQRIAQRITSLIALFPATGAMADDTSNPTVSGIAAYNMCFDGTTWDRCRTVSVACNDPSLTTSVPISTTADVELVALSSSQVVYVCGYNFVVNGAVGIRFIYGTGTVCATGTTGLTGIQSFPAAGDGIAIPNAGAVQFKGAASNALCLDLSASVQVSGVLTYIKQ